MKRLASMVAGQDIGSFDDALDRFDAALVREPAGADDPEMAELRRALHLRG